jgi:hypothetical protein
VTGSSRFNKAVCREEQNGEPVVPFHLKGHASIWKNNVFKRREAEISVQGPMDKTQIVAWFPRNRGGLIIAEPPISTIPDFFLASGALNC